MFLVGKGGFMVLTSAGCRFYVECFVSGIGVLLAFCCYICPLGCLFAFRANGFLQYISLERACCFLGTMVSALVMVTACVPRIS